MLATTLKLEDPRRERLLELRRSGLPLAVRQRKLLACLGLTADTDMHFHAWVVHLQRYCALLARGGVAALTGGVSGADDTES